MKEKLTKHLIEDGFAKVSGQQQTRLSEDDLESQKAQQALQEGGSQRVKEKLQDNLTFCTKFNI